MRYLYDAKILSSSSETSLYRARNALIGLISRYLVAFHRIGHSYERGVSYNSTHLLSHIGYWHNHRPLHNFTDQFLEYYGAVAVRMAVLLSSDEIYRC